MRPWVGEADVIEHERPALHRQGNRPGAVADRFRQIEDAKYAARRSLERADFCKELRQPLQRAAINQHSGLSASCGSRQPCATVNPNARCAPVVAVLCPELYQKSLPAFPPGLLPKTHPERRAEGGDSLGWSPAVRSGGAIGGQGGCGQIMPLRAALGIGIKTAMRPGNP